MVVLMVTTYLFMELQTLRNSI